MPILLVVALLAAACGGAGRSAVSPEPGPAEAVSRFMRAVADSNLTQMAMLWGTARGPAATTGQPANYRERMAVAHAYLKRSQARVLATMDQGRDRALVHVELIRDGCSRRVPFTVVRIRDGSWIVNEFDLAQVGTPGGPCPAEDRRPPP